MPVRQWKEIQEVLPGRGLTGLPHATVQEGELRLDEQVNVTQTRQRCTCTVLSSAEPTRTSARGQSAVRVVGLPLVSG